MKRALFVVPIPPCLRWAGGLLITNLCRAFPTGQVACFAAGPPVHEPLPEDLQGMAVEQHEVTVRARRDFSTLPGELIACLAERRRAGEARRLARRAASLAHSERSEIVLFYLWSDPMIRVAELLQEDLGLPSYSLVADAPEVTAAQCGLDRWTARAMGERLARVLRGSVRCAVNSEPWAAELTAAGSAAVTLYPGFDDGYAQPVRETIGDGERLVLGYCGTAYHDQAWRALLIALDACGWRVAGRQVWIRVFGGGFDLPRAASLRIEYRGWLGEDELMRELNGCDVLYSPCWFAQEHPGVAHWMFPSKTAVFLAAGRPLLYHGAAGTGPARFFAEHGAALLCCSLRADEILAALACLVTDPPLYARLAVAARRAFDDHLTTGRMVEALARWIGVDPAEVSRQEGTLSRARSAGSTDRRINHRREVLQGHRAVAALDRRIEDLHQEVAVADRRLADLRQRLAGRSQ
jgi:hypothetical protein